MFISIFFSRSEPAEKDDVITISTQPMKSWGEREKKKRKEKKKGKKKKRNRPHNGTGSIVWFHVWSGRVHRSTRRLRVVYRSLLTGSFPESTG